MPFLLGLLTKLLLLSVCWCAADNSTPGGSDSFYTELPSSQVGSTTAKASGRDFRLYQNVWYHNTRYYSVEDTQSKPDPVANTKGLLSQNVGLIRLPVHSATAYYRNLQGGWVAGNALLLDFPLPAFPSNQGHWAEVLLPAYSQLALGTWRQLIQGTSQHIDTLLFTNLHEHQLEGISWLWEMLELVLAPARPEGAPLPKALYWSDLEKLDRQVWLGFENLLAVNDRYMHPLGRNGFATPQLGRSFREAAYARCGVQQHGDWAVARPPRTITLLTASGGETLFNRDTLLAALQDVGAALGMAVRPFSVSPGAPLTSYVAAMARTGVLVSRHGPSLANTMFLPPGALVLELLPYNWDWKGVSELYVNITTSLGDVHHTAWRATNPRWASYGTDDEARYADWTPEECAARECTEVHARAGMVADADTIQERLVQLLPDVLQGASVDTLRQPWPRLTSKGNTGLWFDK